MGLSKQKGSRSWHSYFVFISCFMVMVLHFGFFYSIGALFVDIMTTFNSKRAETAVIQSTEAAVMLGSGVLTGTIIAKLGFVKSGILGTILGSISIMVCFFASSLTYMIICIGVFNGIGFSCLYISSSVALGEHFKGRKKLLFMSLQVSGGGIGRMVYPYLVRYLSDLYGFRGTLLIVGALCMNTLPGCFLWKTGKGPNRQQKCNVFPNNIEDYEARFKVHIDVKGDNVNIEKSRQQAANDNPDSVYVSQYPVLQDKHKVKIVVVSAAEKGSTLNRSNEKQTLCQNVKQLWQNKTYILFICGMVVSTPVLNLVTIFMADIFLGSGLTQSDVSLSFFLFNMMSAVGRLLPGILLQAEHISPISLPVFTAIVAAVEIFCMPLVQSRLVLIILTAAIGLAAGMLIAMISIVTIKLVGTDLLPTAMGILFSCNAVGQAVVGPVTGYIRDVTGSYSIPFYSSAVLNLVGATFFFAALVHRRTEAKNVRRRSSIFYLTSL